MIVGPKYHKSQEKYELNATIAKVMHPAAFVLLHYAYGYLSAMYGSDIFFSQQRGDSEVWKLQTLDSKNYTSPEEALSARLKARGNIGVRLIQDLALDELPQVFQVSKDPDRQTDVSIVALRSIMQSDDARMRSAIGTCRHNDWKEIVHEMGHGVFSAYGSFSNEARQRPLLHDADSWMQRYEMDMWQYENGSVETDLLILNGTLALGGIRNYIHENGELPPQATKFLHELGMLQ